MPARSVEALCDDEPLPVWMLACAAILAAPAGLSVTAVCRAVVDLSGGRRSGRLDSVGNALASLRARGFARRRSERVGLRVPSQVHTLTPAGVAHYTQACAHIARVLSLAAPVPVAGALPASPDEVVDAAFSASSSVEG